MRQTHTRRGVGKGGERKDYRHKKVRSHGHSEMRICLHERSDSPQHPCTAETLDEGLSSASAMGLPSGGYQALAGSGHQARRFRTRFFCAAQATKLAG